MAAPCIHRSTKHRHGYQLARQGHQQHDHHSTLIGTPLARHEARAVSLGERCEIRASLIGKHHISIIDWKLIVLQKNGNGCTQDLTRPNRGCGSRRGTNIFPNFRVHRKTHYYTQIPIRVITINCTAEKLKWLHRAFIEALSSVTVTS